MNLKFFLNITPYEVLQTTWESKKNKNKNQKTESTENVQSQTRRVDLLLLFVDRDILLINSFHELRAEAINSFHNSQPPIKEPI